MSSYPQSEEQVDDMVQAPLSTQWRQAPTYHTFVLRCWDEGAGNDADHHWRFSVEALSGQCEKRGFDQLEELVQFLETHLAGHNTVMLPDSSSE